MANIELIDSFAEELTAIRRDLHAHPEIGFEEHRTSGIVAEKLASWGIEVHRGLGGTGVVGLLKGKGNGTKRIGLRADMDALPMEEKTNLSWRSTIPAAFMAAVTTAIPPSFSAPRAILRRPAILMVPSRSSSSLPKKGLAAHAR
jgi:metal-dependent amidase/aminoacylase/carboxypeptidase family protein